MEKLKPILVIISTLGVLALNYLAAAGYIGGITPSYLSDKFPTLITPAGYAFTIWGWIYMGLIVFSVLQILPQRLAKYNGVRTLYVASCVANCAWIILWHNQQIALSLVAITGLLAVLAFLNVKLERENNLFARIVFGAYFGWVTVATVVNATITLVASGFSVSDATAMQMAIGLIVVATVIGIALRHALPNVAYPLAVAWAITAIAVKQSGKTALIVACALCVVALLISACSFVLKDYKKPDEQR